MSWDSNPGLRTPGSVLIHEAETHCQAQQSLVYSGGEKNSELQRNGQLSREEKCCVSGEATEVVGQGSMGSEGHEDAVRLVWEWKGRVASRGETGGAGRAVSVELQEKERHQHSDRWGSTREHQARRDWRERGSGWRAYQHSKYSGKSKGGQQTQVQISALPLITHATLGKPLDFCKPRVPPRETRMMIKMIKTHPPAAEEGTTEAASTGTGWELAVDGWWLLFSLNRSLPHRQSHENTDLPDEKHFSTRTTGKALVLWPRHTADSLTSQPKNQYHSGLP